MAFSVAVAERFFKVLGDDSRLRILQALGERECPVSEFLEATRSPRPSLPFTSGSCARRASSPLNATPEVRTLFEELGAKRRG